MERNDSPSTRAMKLVRWTALVVMLLLVSSAFSAPRSPYSAGSILPSLWSQQQLDEQLEHMYSRWKGRYLKCVKGSDPVQKFVHWNVLEREWVDADAITVSEAHGYGMLILAWMAGFDPRAREDFDAMFRFFKAHPAYLTPELMCWKVLGQTDENLDALQTSLLRGGDSATDGDLDIAFSLLLAHQLWGSEGSIDYQAEALQLLDAIAEREIHPLFRFVQLGDWVQVHTAYANLTRSSDFLLDHFRWFAGAQPERSDLWMGVWESCVRACEQTFAGWTPQTGLMPDFLVIDRQGGFQPAKGMVLETRQDGDFNWNACRVPWRLSMDFLLFGDRTMLGQLQHLNRWIQEETKGNPLHIHPGYFIRSGPEGTEIPRDWEGSHMSFLAPFAVAAMVDASNQQWLNRLWQAMVSDSWSGGIPFDEVEYFPNTLRLLCMIVVSGHAITPNMVYCE
ncbi:MAG TPA: glycosyl hydrolase family 8 [Thermotogota bacterium]|nr:glycosyl hydrolase family 8 [Thermotogota bacterium]